MTREWKYHLMLFAALSGAIAVVWSEASGIDGFFLWVLLFLMSVFIRAVWELIKATYEEWLRL